MLHFGKPENKVPFDIFREKMGTYISRTIKYSNEVLGVVETYKDVRDTYETNHMSNYLNIEDNKSEVKEQIQNQLIKMYVKKEMEMVNNIGSIYENNWGQYIYPPHNMINHLDEFTVKHKEKDVIWILKNLKIVSTGIYSLGNECVNYFISQKLLLTCDKDLWK